MNQERIDRINTLYHKSKSVGLTEEEKAEQQLPLKELLEDPSILKVAQNLKYDYLLMKRYGIVGPPATLFIQQNEEARPARLIGFEDSQRFLSRVNALPKVERLQCQPETQLAHNAAPSNAKPC